MSGGGGGLYDDLPEPAAAPLEDGAEGGGGGSKLPLARPSWPRRRAPSGGAALACGRLDDASAHAMLSFLPLASAGAAVPAVSRLWQWLRDTWPLWQCFAAPLRRRAPVRIVRLLNSTRQSMEELVALSAAVETAALSGFSTSRGVPFLGGAGSYHYFYGGLPIQRVLWSLHTEGVTPWRGVCSMPVDADFALLPPWDDDAAGLRSVLPSRVRLLVGISLWLPPEGVDAARSFPALYLNVALESPSVLQAVASQHAGAPPCVSATCQAVLFRPGGPGACRVLEEWDLRFCFGPEGYRHPGHGVTDGYGAEEFSAGRRKWRPPNLCECLDGHRPQDHGLHLLLRGCRCEGLLD